MLAEFDLESDLFRIRKSAKPFFARDSISLLVDCLIAEADK